MNRNKKPRNEGRRFVNARLFTVLLLLLLLPPAVRFLKLVQLATPGTHPLALEVAGDACAI